MKRTIIYFLLFLIAGIASRCILGSDIVQQGIVFISSVGISIYLLHIFHLKRIFIFPLFTLLGIILASNALNIPIEAQKDYDDAELYAVVKDVYENPEFSYCVLEAEKLISDDKEQKLHFDVRLYNYSEEALTPGDIIKAKCSLQKADENKSDEFYYFRSENISMKGTLTSFKKISEVDIPEYYRYCFQKKIFDILHENMPNTEADVLSAMLSGRNEFLSEGVKENFRKAGIYHIMAISGMHMGIIAALFMALFMYTGSRFRSIAVILLLWSYCFLAGANPPSVRAAFMFSILAAAPLLNRLSDFICAACASCIVSLLFDPLLLFSVGFIYSYGIIFAIGFIIKPIFDYKKYNLLIKIFVPTFIICCVSKFISAYFFSYISMYDIFANIFIALFASAALIAGILTVIVGMFIPFAASFVGAAASGFVLIMESCADFFANLPYAYINTGRPSEIFVLAFIFLLLSIVTIIYNERTFDIRYIRFEYKLLAVLACVFFLAVNLTEFFAADNKLNISFLYVKEGDCIACSVGNLNFAIDGGGDTYIHGSEEPKRIENKTLLEYYDRKGIENIDYVFVSHTDSDHIDGIYNLLGKKNIGRVIMSDTLHDSKNYERFAEKCQKTNTKITYIKKEDTIYLADNVSVKCLYPGDTSKEDGNASSLVLMLEYGKERILFTGDIDSSAEHLLVDKDIHADILKVAHHGSKYSSDMDFIKAVSPQIAIVSAGKGNKYGFPAEETVKKFNEADIPLYSTSENGNIYISLYESSMEISCEHN